MAADPPEAIDVVRNDEWFSAPHEVGAPLPGSGMTEQTPAGACENDTMANDADNPFDSIEGAQEYVHLLQAALDEALISIQQDIETMGDTPAGDRRLDALRLVNYKLGQLRQHLSAGSRLLNDLRTLRRLLLAERGQAPQAPTEGM